MGDRTTVTLDIRKTDFERIKGEPWFEHGEDEEEYAQGDIVLVSIIHHEVNYGELPFLEHLAERGIPYDVRWEAGGGYTAGYGFLRFTPEGKAKLIEYNDEDENPPFHRLLFLSHDLPDTHPLRQYLLQWQEDHVPDGWENQEQYGELYRTLQLLDPALTK